MAASVARSPAPRTGSAKWGRPRPIPVVHPMAMRSMELDLTIRGTPTPGLTEETPRILQWPPEHLTKPKINGRTKTRATSTVWRTDNDLVEQVREKLTTGYAGVKQMFKARDPYGDSIVTREGLYKIMQILVGHISRDQFDSFLKTIHLHWRSSISFDEFIVKFADNPAVALQTLSDIKRHERQQQQAKQLEENLRSEDMLEWCPFTSAPHAFVMFRKRLQKGEVNIRDILPPACFLHDGRVIAPQLREALAQVGIRLTDNEFDHIWQKFDPDNNGTVPIKRLYKTLELTSNGLPKPDPRAVRSAKQARAKAAEVQQKRCKTEMQMTSTTRQSTSISKVDAVEICGSRADIIGSRPIGTAPQPAGSQGKPATAVTTTKEEVEETTTTTTTTTTKTKKTMMKEKKEEPIVDDAKLSAHVRSLIQSKKSPPQLNNIMDQLHYKFEETYRNLQSAFKLFDFMNDGYVTRIDFRRVLREFGFEITAVDLDTFLNRAGISVIQGLINYNQFLQRFQSHKENSITTRVLAQNGGNGFNQNSFKRIETEENLRAEEMEKNVVNFFHADYIKLLNMLKQKDVNNTGIVPAEDLRNAVNSVLKIRMTDQQFDELIQKLSQKSVNGNGPQINYSTFLELFNSEPGMWNTQRDGQFVTQRYQLTNVPVATPVLRLTEKAKTWMAPPPDRDAEARKRVVEIRKELTKLFTDRFHIVDKNFKDMDRRQTGYMTKWQFGALIKLCGVTVTVHDLDFLWGSLDTAADNTLSYVTLVKTFGRGQQHQQQLQQQKQQSASKSGSAKPVVGLERQKTAPALIVDQPRVVPGSAKEGRLKEILTRVKDDVMQKWDLLYSIFLSLDRDGYSSISIQEMRDIAYKMRFPLTTSERDDLCNFFDLHANGWFHYLSFLQAVKKLAPQSSKSTCAFDIHTKRLHKKASQTSMAVTLYDFLVELKGILLKKYKTLRGSFKSFDLNHNGYIEEGELRKSLASLGYHLSEKDFIDVLQLLDRSQGQKISFEDFKATLLTI